MLIFYYNIDVYPINKGLFHHSYSKIIRFKAYDYFIVLFNYDKGVIGCSIQYGENSFISLENSQKWYEKADFDVFCKELKKQLELRIPDKFLEANGWK